MPANETSLLFLMPQTSFTLKTYAYTCKLVLAGNWSVGELRWLEPNGHILTLAWIDQERVNALMWIPAQVRGHI